MGSGVSRPKSSKVVLQKLPSADNCDKLATNLHDGQNSLTTDAKQEENTNVREMELSSTVKNQPNIKSLLANAEKTVQILTSHVSEGTLANKDVVSCCVELLKFSGSMDESEELKTAAVNFVLKMNIPGLILEVYGALITKYPNVANFDREKVKVSEIFFKVSFFLTFQKFQTSIESEKSARRICVIECFETRSKIQLYRKLSWKKLIGRPQVMCCVKIPINVLFCFD